MSKNEDYNYNPNMASRHLSRHNDLRLHIRRSRVRGSSRNGTLCMAPTKSPPKFAAAARPAMHCRCCFLVLVWCAPLLPSPPQGDRTREPCISLPFRSGARERERLGRIAPRDEAAGRRAFQRIFERPRDAPPFPFYRLRHLLRHGPLLREGALASPRDLLQARGVLLLVALRAQEVDLGPARRDGAEMRGVELERCEGVLVLEWADGAVDRDALTDKGVATAIVWL